jgi:hypothetical protein
MRHFHSQNAGFEMSAPIGIGCRMKTSAWPDVQFKPPQTIFTSPESGPEGSASLLSSLDDLPTREMLGLPDRESSPEEVDDDDNNSLEHLFWIPPDVENPSNSLRPSSPALKPPSLVSEPVSYVSVLEPVSSVPIPEPMSSTSVQEPVSPTPAPEPPFPAPVPTPDTNKRLRKR